MIICIPARNIEVTGAMQWRIARRVAQVRTNSKGEPPPPEQVDHWITRAALEELREQLAKGAR